MNYGTIRTHIFTSSSHLFGTHFSLHRHDTLHHDVDRPHLFLVILERLTLRPSTSTPLHTFSYDLIIFTWNVFLIYLHFVFVFDFVHGFGSVVFPRLRHIQFVYI